MRNIIMEVNNNSVNGSEKETKDAIRPDVYQIAHDLRAPLMSIQGLINLMKSDLKKEHLEEYIVLLETSIKKMDHSISAIIDYSKNDNTQEIATQQIDFKTLINESLLSMQFMEEAELVDITVSVQETGLFLSDYDRLLSVFSNLISNAIRYRDQNKKSFLNIAVSFMNGKAVVVLADNGIGIDQVFQSKIFDKLFRVNQDDRGSGLGLHIVHKTIKKLNGEMKLHSVLGEGTTFTIEIPNFLSSTISIR